MGWRVWFSLVCDSCGDESPKRISGGKPNAEDSAASIGWHIAKPRGHCPLHLCPECAAKPRPEWWPVNAETLETGSK